jgi:hypothetical protein
MMAKLALMRTNVSLELAPEQHIVLTAINVISLVFVMCQGPVLLNLQLMTLPVTMAMPVYQATNVLPGDVVATHIRATITFCAPRIAAKAMELANSL